MSQQHLSIILFCGRTYLYGIHPLPDTHERSFVGTVVQQEDTVRPTEVRLGYASKSVNRTKSLLVEKVRIYKGVFNYTIYIT